MNKFKLLRKNAGLSQRDVAKKFGYGTVQFVSNWERGLCTPPLKSAKALAKLFKVKPEVLKEIYQEKLEEKIEKYF